MKIRKASEKDKKEALGIAKELKEWFSKEGIKNINIDLKLNNVVVVADGKKVIGFLCYTSYSGRMQLIWIGIKKNFQRKGIGEKLLKWLENESRKLRLYSIEVETLPDEDSYEPYKLTRDFYYKNGFKRVAYKKAIIKEWDDQIVLEKRLK